MTSRLSYAAVAMGSVILTYVFLRSHFLHNNSHAAHEVALVFRRRLEAQMHDMHASAMDREELVPMTEAGEELF